MEIALILSLLIILVLSAICFYLQRRLIQSDAKKAQLAGHLEALTNEETKRAQIKHEIKNEFENLANRIFDEKGKKFTDINQTLLNPLKEQMGDFRKKVEAVHEKNIADRASLLTKIEELQSLNQKIEWRRPIQLTVYR